MSPPSQMQISRLLGDSELSYFLPSRADGVNDMYLHIGFRAPALLVSPHRVSIAWSILRGRHPLLAAHVLTGQNDIRFVYTIPASVEDALADAQASFEVRTGTKDALIDSYLNGLRTLSNKRISYLILSSPSDDPDVSADTQEYDILICAAHFLGDGMALHSFANDLFFLLAGDSRTDDASLEALHATEWLARRHTTTLPAPLEERFPPTQHALQRAAHEVAFQCSQTRLIGGHAFARTPAPCRRTLVPTVSFDSETTRAALASCKRHGVSIAHAIFALCNIVWARGGGAKAPELPILMYSALNLRPYLLPHPTTHPSYWFLAVGYFNVVLPTFLPASASTARTFWTRARAAKVQCTRAAQTPLLLSHARCMAHERAARARAFAKLDDALAPPSGVTISPAPASALPPPSTSAQKHPSAALIGLSLLGNLDATYKHATYAPQGVVLHTLTTGSRQRAGGMLMFVYTFVGRLWLSLGYDVCAYKDEEVCEWWRSMCDGVKEFLVCG